MIFLGAILSLIVSVLEPYSYALQNLHRLGTGVSRTGRVFWEGGGGKAIKKISNESGRGRGRRGKNS